MVGYQRFGGPCFLHLQGDFTQMTTTLVKVELSLGFFNEVPRWLWP